MKRFFCTVCKKVKRVQRWPIIIQDVDSIHPTERVGECNRHSNPRPIRQVFNKINQEQAEGRIHRTAQQVRRVR